MRDEEWRPIPGYEGLYSVSSFGRVRTEARVTIQRNGRHLVVPERIRKTPTNKYGYPEVSLHRNRSMKCWLVHQLVLLAFVGPCPTGPGRIVSCHNDGNPGNPHASNLRWDTQRANVADSVKHGVMPRGEQAPWSRLTQEQVLAIRADARRNSVLAIEYGVDPSHISRIRTRDVWTHI